MSTIKEQSSSNKQSPSVGSGTFEHVTHVIFDCDGLLVDSEQYYHDAMQIVARRYNKEFNFSIKCEMMGTRPNEGAKIALERLGLLDQLKPEEFVRMYTEEMAKHCHKIKMMPGAERLIRHLEKHQVPMAIGTGSAKSGFELKTGHIGDLLRKPFCHHVFGGSDEHVKQGKPAPDIFKVAAQRFKPAPKSPKSVLVFEDAVNGIIAAQSAGMQTIFVPDKWVDMSKVSVKPTQILKSLLDFKPELFGLPAFD